MDLSRVCSETQVNNNNYLQRKSDRLLEEWIHRALDEPGIRLLDFTLDIAIASMRLPGHLGTNDPRDKAIVATARLHPCPLITSDGPLRDYSYVETI